MHIAARVKCGEKSAEMLLKSGANVNEAMSNGETPLHVAARNGNKEIMQKLLQEGGDPQVVSNVGNSPLHIAARHCHYAIAKELLEHVTHMKSRMDAVMLVNWGNNVSAEGGRRAEFLTWSTGKKQQRSGFTKEI